MSNPLPTPPQSSAAGRALVLSLALTAAACWAVGRAEALGELRLLALCLALTPPLALAAWAAERLPRPTRGHLALLLGGALLLRLLLPWPGLIASDDATRYLWDGRVLDHGINPYLHPPEDPELAHLREPVFHPNIFRPDMRTVYPPLAQLWFWVAYRLHPTGYLGLKAVLLGHELVTIWLLLLLLRRAGAPPLRAVIYAWAPLPVGQLMGGGHLDGLLTPWLLLALWLHGAGRPLATGASLAASALVRPVTLLALPALARVSHRPSPAQPSPAPAPRLGPALGRLARHALLTAAGFVGICAAALLPFYARAGARMVESLRVYGRHWRFNGSIFQLAEAHYGPVPEVRGKLYRATAVCAAAAPLLPLSAAGRTLFALGAYYALAPTVYPWYLLPLAALAALFGGPTALLLGPLVQLSDLVWLQDLLGRPWQLPRSVLLWEYGLLYALLAAELWRRWQRRAASSTGTDPA